MVDPNLNQNPKIEESIAASEKLINDSNALAYEASFGGAGVSSNPLEVKIPDPTKTAQNNFNELSPVKTPEVALSEDTQYDLAMQGLANQLTTAISNSENKAKYADKALFGTNAQHYNLARFKAMDNIFYKEYSKLGFDPYRNNEDYYNTYASAGNDFWRSMSGITGNFNTGFTNWYHDTIFNPYGDSAYKAVETADYFAQNIATTQSTRKGIMPFIANTSSQLGLALGMMGGFMSETAGVTLLTGGLGTKASLAAGGARMFSFARRAKNLGNFYKRLKDAQGVRKIYQAGLGLGKGVANNMMPNTISGWKNINKVDDLASFARVAGDLGGYARGFGNFYKDVGIARMAVGESKIEGGLVYKEEETKLLNEFRKTFGRDPNTEEYAEIQQAADDAARTTFMWNFPLIYGTNLITFGRMFTPMRQTMFKSLDREFIKNAAGKVVTNQGKASVVKAGKKTVKGGLKKGYEFVKTPRVWGQKGLNLGKGFLKYTKANFSEGVQEFFQEVISDSAIEYHSDIYWSEDGNADVGDWYRLLGENTKKYMSPAGFEIFMSGFAMGGGMNILGGAGKAVGAQLVKIGTVGKSAKAKYENYMAQKEELLEQVANSYNEVAQNPLDYFNPNLENLVTQKNIEREKAEAEAVGDKKAFKDAVSTGDFYNITHLINTGKYDEMLDQVRDFKNLSVEEFNEATGAGVNNKDEMFDLVDGMVDKAQSIEKNYKELIKAYPSPYNPLKYERNSPEQFQEALLQKAHERFIQNASYAGFKLDDALQRRSEIYNKLTTKSLWRSKNISDQAGSDQFERLIDKQVLENELFLLTGEIDELNNRKTEGIITPKEKKELKDKTEMYDMYAEYSDALKAYYDLTKNTEIQVDKENNILGKYSEEQVVAQKEAAVALHVSFINLVEHMAKVNGGIVNREQIDNALEAIKDYQELEADADYYGEAVNYIASRDVYEEQVKRHAAVLDASMQRQGATIRKHIEASHKRAEAGAIVDDIAKAGYYLSTDGIAQLFDEATVPTEFLDTTTHKAITAADPEYAEVAEIVLDFLKGVKEAGLTVEEQDARLKAEREAAGEATEETTEGSPTTEFEGVTDLVLEKHNLWTDDVKEQAEALLTITNKRRVANNKEAFATVGEWAATKPDQLYALLTEANLERKRKANEAKKNAKAAELKKQRESGQQIPPPKTPPQAPSTPPSQTKPEGYTPEVLQPEGATNEPKWKPDKKGKSLREISSQVLDKIIANQNNVKRLKDFSNAEAKTLGIDNTAHGYVIKSKSGKWIPAKSVTQSTGSPFDIKLNHTVIIKATGEKGIVTISPDQNTKYLKDNAKNDIFMVKLEDNTEKEFTGAELENITYIDSTDAGTLVDLIVRDFFSAKGIKARDKYLNKENESISEEAYKNLVDSLNQLKKENPGFQFAAQGIILFDENAKGGPIAGEIDLLLYNEETGEFRIWDVKTRKVEKGPFWEVDPKVANTQDGLLTIGPPKLNESFSTSVFPNRRGINEMTSQVGYEKQLSVYKNLFETQYGIRLSSTSLVPYSIKFVTKTNPKTDVQYLHIETLEKESNIPLNYQPSIEAIVESVNVKPIDETVGEGQIGSISPTVFENDPFAPVGDDKVIAMTFSKQHGKSLAAGNKSTTIRTVNGLGKSKFLKEPLATALIEVNGEQYKVVSRGQLTHNEAGSLIKKAAAETLAGKVKHMSEEMASKIAEVDDMNISDSDKNALRLVISEGLPTDKPAEWKQENPITIDGTTYYSMISHTAKWLAGSGKMVFLQVAPAPKIKVDDLSPELDLMKIFGKDIATADMNKLVEIEKRYERSDLGPEGTTRPDVTSLFAFTNAIAARRLELEDSLLVNQLEPGDVLRINPEYLEKENKFDTFEEIVSVHKIHPTYIEVINMEDSEHGVRADGSYPRIYNTQFDKMVIEKAENTVAEEDTTFTPEEEEVIKENVENTGKISSEESSAIREANKDKSVDDILGDLTDNIEEC